MNDKDYFISHMARTADRLRDYNDAYRRADANETYGNAHAALTKGIKTAMMAAPDSLSQIPSAEEAAALILSTWPIR